MNIRLIGGEMLVWSDLDGEHGPGPVRGTGLAPLLAAAQGRTLVAGPHDPTLIDALPVSDLTLLVRGVPDAEVLAARYAERQGVAVWCGSPEKLAAEPPFDTVIALDGLGRLSSVEGPELTWAAAFDVLAGVLRPGGRLLLAVENTLGLHRLVALPPQLSDSDWTPSTEYDRTRPSGPGRVRARLNAAGFAVGRAYAAYPSPTEPTVLLAPEILAYDEVHGFLEATLSRACAPLDATLIDPARLAVRAVRNGVATDLAPAWVLLAQREPASGSGAETTEEMYTSTQPIAITPDATIAPDGLRALPRGRTREDLLISAGLERDVPALRELLVAWQSDETAGVPADQAIIDNEGAVTALVAPGSASDALRGFAATLIRGGFAHPFASTASADDVAGTLAVMAGVGLDPAPRAETPSSYAELLASRERLVRQLAEAESKALWYEQALSARDDALRRAQRLVELLSATGPAKAGKALMGGAKAARRSVRLVVRKVKPRT